MNESNVCNSISNILESSITYNWEVSIFLCGYSLINFISKGDIYNPNFISSMKSFNNKLNSINFKNYECIEDVKIVQEYFNMLLILEKLRK